MARFFWPVIVISDKASTPDFQIRFAPAIVALIIILLIIPVAGVFRCLYFVNICIYSKVSVRGERIKNGLLKAELSSLDNSVDKAIKCLLDPNGKPNEMPFAYYAKASIVSFPEIHFTAPKFFAKKDRKSSVSLSQFSSEVSPTEGVISSGFGVRSDPLFEGSAFHTGLDIANKPGTPVCSAKKGIVVFAKNNNLWGNMVTVDHGDGYTTIYAHLQKILVKNGDTVTTRQPLGLLGSTGKSTGPHLHFEVRKNGRPTNPVLSFISGEAEVD